MANNRGGLSKREFEAKQSGGKLNYSTGKISIPKMAAPKPILPKSVANQTPAAKIATAQKSQPVYGPAIPKDFKPDYSSAFSSLPKSFSSPVPSVKKTVLPKLDAVKNYQPTEEEKRLNKIQADPATPTKAQLDRLMKNDREQVLNRNIPKMSSTAKDLLTPSLEGKTFKEVATDTSGSIKDRVKGIGKGIGRTAIGVLSLGAQFQKRNPFASAETRRKAEEDIKMMEDKLSGKEGTPGADIRYSNNAERQGGLVTDIAQLPFIGGKSSALKAGVGRIVNKAIDKGVSPSGIGRLIKMGESGAFSNTMEGIGKTIGKDAQIRANGNRMLGEDIASGTSSAIRPKRALASDIPADIPPMQSIPKIASEITPEARVASLADNVPKVDNLAVAKRTMASGANADEVIKNIPEVPKGNHGRRNEIFTEPDHAGKEKVFMNVDDGGKELKKIEVGEVDAEGKVIEKMSEDGRPMSEVITEAQNNLEHGKRLVKLDTPSGTVRNVVREGKKGKLSLNGIQTKMNAARDAKVAKIAEDANIQDHIKSKIDKLRAAMEAAPDPETRFRLEKQLNDEISILRDYPKMSAEDRQFFKDRSLRENPGLADSIYRDYNDARSFKAPVVAETAPKKGIFGGTLKGFIKNPLAKEDPRLQEARKYKSAEEFVNGTKDSIKKVPLTGNSRKYLSELFQVGDSNTYIGYKKTGKVSDVMRDVFDGSGKSTGKMRGETPEVDFRVFQKEDGFSVENAFINAQRSGDGGITTLDELPKSLKSQLTDLWKEANGKKLKTLKGFVGGDAPKVTRNIPKDLSHNSEAGNQVLAEMEMSQAGTRHFIGSGSDAQVIGESSTFPKWVPDNLRSSSLFRSVEKHIEDGTFPKGSRQQELYDVIHAEMRNRQGLPTVDHANLPIQTIQPIGKLKKIAPKSTEDPIDVANRRIQHITDGRKSNPFIDVRGKGFIPNVRENKVIDEGIKNAVKKDADLARKESAAVELVKYDGSLKGAISSWLRNSFKGKAVANEEALAFKIKENPENIMKHEAGQNYEGRDKVTAKFDELFKKAEEAGIKLEKRDNYIPHVYNESPEQIKKAVAKALEDKGVDASIVDEYLNGSELPSQLAKSLKMNPFFTKERAFNSYAEAAKYGLTPKYDTMAQLVGHYVEKMNDVIANRKLVDDLVASKQLTSAPGNTKLAVNIPGNIGEYYANPKVAAYLNDYFRNEDALNVLQVGAKYAAKFSKGLQNIVLAGGLPKTNLNFFTFGHVIKSLTTGIGNVGTLNARGALTNFKALTNLVRSNFTTPSIKWFNTRVENGIMGKMANEGIDMSHVVGNFRENNRGLMKFFQKTDTRKMFGEGYDRVLSEKTFNSFLPMQTTTLFEDTYNAAVKNGLSESEASRLAGETTKNFMGFTDQLRGKTAEDALSATFFAPKFREGLINTYWNTIKSLSPSTWANPAFAQNRKLALGMGITLAGYDYLNEKLNGHHMWDNPEGKKLELMIPGKGGKIYYTPFMPSQLAFFRNIAEAGMAASEGDLKTTVQKAGSNLSMGLKLVTDIIGNKDYFGNEIYDTYAPASEQLAQIGKYVGQNANHPYVKGVWNLALNMNAEKQGIYPVYKNVTDLLNNGRREEANAIINGLSPQAKAEYDAMKAEKLKPTGQVISEMMELPIRFSSQGKIASQEYYKGIESIIKTAKSIQDNAQRTKKIQEMVSSVPEAERRGILNALSDAGVSVKGVSASEAIIQGNKKLDELANGADASTLSEEDVKNINAALKSEKAKTTKENKMKMKPVADKLSEMMKAGDDKGVSDLIDTLSPDEVHALGLVLGIRL